MEQREVHAAHACGLPTKDVKSNLAKLEILLIECVDNITNGTKKVLYELPYLVLEVIFPNSMQSLSLFHYDTTAGLMTIQIIEYHP